MQCIDNLPKCASIAQAGAILLASYNRCLQLFCVWYKLHCWCSQYLRVLGSWWSLPTLFVSIVIYWLLLLNFSGWHIPRSAYRTMLSACLKSFLFKEILVWRHAPQCFWTLSKLWYFWFNILWWFLQFPGAEHAAMRSLVGPCFTDKAVACYVPFIADLANRCCTRLAKQDSVLWVEEVWL